MCIATPPSELLSEPAARASGWCTNKARKVARVALALRVYLQEAGACVLRLACVCECVSVCVRSGGWPGASFSPKGKGRDTLVGP